MARRDSRAVAWRLPRAAHTFEVTDDSHPAAALRASAGTHLLRPMGIEIRLLGPGELCVLDRVADDVFDGPIEARWARAFLADARHHLLVALDDDLVVGMASAVNYVHPDKAPQLWINEVGVAPTHRRRGIGRQLLEALLAHGRMLGCTEAWLGTEEGNLAARHLYESAGSVAASFVLYSFPLEPGEGPGAAD